MFHEGVCMYSSEGTVLSQKMCMCVLLSARVCGKKWQMVAGVCCRWSSCRLEDVQQQDKARKHECTRVCVCVRERQRVSRISHSNTKTSCKICYVQRRRKTLKSSTTPTELISEAEAQLKVDLLCSFPAPCLLCFYSWALTIAFNDL